jgi:hypothetical protein
MMALLLVLSTSTATFASGGGPGGGGGGGGGGASGTNPFVGQWEGALPSAFNPMVVYQFTFAKDFTYTLVETDHITGVVSTFTGTYAVGGAGPDGLPLLTLFSRGQVLMQEEYSPSGGAFVLRGTLFIVIGKI